MTKVEIVEAKRGGYSAIVHFFDYEVQMDRKLYLCSRIDPLKEGEAWAENTYDPSIKYFIIYGMGLGYHIKALKQKLHQEQKIYILESNKQVYETCLPYISKEILEDPRIQILHTKNPIKMRDLFNKIPMNESQFTAYLPCVKVIPPSLIGIKQLVEKQLLKKNTNKKWGDIIKKHYEINNEKNYANVSSFFNQYKDKPMILVSAGPSLDVVLETLKNVGEDVLIFATGRVLKLLLSKGIRVDFFCIIDPSDQMTIKQVEDLEALEIPFIFLNTVGPQTIESYKGPKYIAYSQDSPLDQEGRIESGGSVATAVLDLGIKFGCNPIIFVGQDLAYSGQSTHCNGVNGKKSINEAYRKKVKAIDGSYLPTTVPLLSFKKWIEEEIRRYPNIQFINATAYGAYIEGCKHQSLKETLKQYSH